MRRALKLIVITAAAVLAAAAVFVLTTLPPRALSVDSAPRDPRLIWGGYHVHTVRSDGSGTPDDIAAAAERAGLQFVIFTDHGDGTALPPSTYRHGVLCIEGVEINSEAGHIVALGLRGPSPFPLAGESADVIEDVHRLGGVAIAAHPDSPGPALRWRGATSDVDGFEWLNVDAAWRNQSASRLLAIGLRAMARAPESIGSLLTARPSFERWDRSDVAQQFSIGALDAHARVGADSDGSAPAVAIRWPAYETLFRSLAQAVALEAPLTGDAVADARAVVERIKARRSYTIVRAFADVLAPLRFEGAESGIGGEVGNLPDAEVDLLRDGRLAVSGRQRVAVQPAAPGRYRLVIRLKNRNFPWIVSDAIDVPAAQTSAPTPGAIQDAPPAAAAIGVVRTDWRVEKDPTSSASLDAAADRTILTFQLGGGPPSGQYVALAAPAGPDPIERIEFTTSARTPMRISVQVRVAGGADGQRWRKSVYVDSSPRHVSLRLSDLRPVDRRSSLRPIVARVQSVLVVIDTVNARPGASGQITVADFRLVRGRTPSGEDARLP